MLEGITHDQLRTLAAVADEGSFSAAGRRLRRAQSVVSQTIANLEAQLEVSLFDRSARYPVLTAPGRVVLAQARVILAEIDALKAHARTLAGGIEAELSVVVDVMFPLPILTRAITQFQAAFPHTPLRLYVEALGAVLQPVLQGVCSVGVTGSLPTVPSECHAERLLGVPLVWVAAPQHPLALAVPPLARRALERHTQLVLTDRTALSAGHDFGVYSPRTWRLADLGAKHGFLRAGLGWGSMPLHLVEADLAAGRLRALQLEDTPAGHVVMPMSAIYRQQSPPRPAGRWLIDRLRELAPPPGPAP